MVWNTRLHGRFWEKKAYSDWVELQYRDILKD